jgi:hypothetical protein
MVGVLLVESRTGSSDGAQDVLGQPTTDPQRLDDLLGLTERGGGPPGDRVHQIPRRGEHVAVRQQPIDLCGHDGGQDAGQVLATEVSTS